VNNQFDSVNAFTTTLAYEADNDLENNDDLLSAKLLPSDTSIKMSINGSDGYRSCAEDVDYFKIKPKKNGLLEISLTNIPTLLADLKLRFIDSTTGNSIELSKKGTSTISESFIVSGTGTYYVYIYDSFSALNSGIMTLGLKLDTSDRYEFNNSMETATKMPFNSNFNLNLKGLDVNSNYPDIDYYKVTGKIIGEVSIYIYYKSNIYRRFEVKVIDSTTGGAFYLTHSYLDDGGNAVFNFRSDHVYYIQISKNKNDTDGENIKLAISYNGNDINEYNNTKETAKLITTEYLTSFRLFGKDINDYNRTDVDYFKIKATKDEKLIVCINIGNSNANNNTLLQVIDSTNDSIIHTYFSKSGLEGMYWAVTTLPVMTESVQIICQSPSY
jgi:hypothetical protein